MSMYVKVIQNKSTVCRPLYNRFLYSLKLGLSCAYKIKPFTDSLLAKLPLNMFLCC